MTNTSRPASDQSQRLLVIGDAAQLDQWREIAADADAIRTVADVDEAYRLIRGGRFAAVISALPAFRGLLNVSTVESRMLLEMIGHPLCVVDHGGNVLWSNSRFDDLRDAASESIRTTAAEMCRTMMNDANAARQAHRGVPVGGEVWYEMTASPVKGPSDRVDRVVVLARDVTSARRAQERINAIDAAGRALVRLDADALRKQDVGDRLHLLESEIIRYSRELMNFRHFSVRVLDRKSNRLEVLLAEGMSSETLARQIYAEPEGNGIVGYVASTGRSYICPDAQRDQRVLPGIENTRSTLTVPLQLHDQVVGTFNVESEEVAAFSEDDRQIAEIFGRYVAIALNTLQLLAVERHAATGEVTADVVAELAAPINDIVSRASSLMEDYIGHDDVRRRLHEIIDALSNVSKRIHAMGESPLLSAMSPMERSAADPILDRKRILIAEDEDVIRETIAAVLENAGAVVDAAPDGEAALRLVAGGEFDLIISDIKMPLHSGYEVFAAAKAARPETRVILITGFGYDPDHAIVRASREGLTGVLFKPFKTEALLAEARKALSGKTRN